MGIPQRQPRRRPKKWGEHGRVFKTLTFWLRPAFILRTIGRFQKIAGFDRAIALASSALTGLIPLAVLAGAILGRSSGEDLADSIIRRYELSGAGAEAVTAAFSPAAGTETTVSIFGTFFLLVAVLSFTRTVQRLFEQVWELPPLSVRNTLNGMRWLLGVVVYGAVTGIIHSLAGGGRLNVVSAACIAPFTAVFLAWTGWRLSAKRIDWRDLVPFGVIAAIVTAIYSVGAAVYVPDQFSSYAARYGVVGAVLAMISTLFCVMVAIVGSAALGREVSRELGRIKRGERPPEDEIRKEWDKIVAEGRSRWATARAQIDRYRRRSGRAPAQEELPHLRDGDDQRPGADTDQPLAAAQLDGVEDPLEEPQLGGEHDRAHGQQRGEQEGPVVEPVEREH
jgi:membrane protein